MPNLKLIHILSNEKEQGERRKGEKEKRRKGEKEKGKKGKRENSIEQHYPFTSL